MRFKLLAFIFGILITLTFVLASFQLGTKAIEKSYGAGEILRGSVTLGFNDTLGSTLLTAFNSSITLKEFLDANNAGYSCQGGCNQNFVDSNARPSQTISLNYSEEKVIGLKLIGQINSIEKFSFNISSNAEKSCEIPLEINLLNDGVVEWRVENASDDFNCLAYDIYGCFDVNEASESTKITTVDYCEKIKIPVVKEYKLGADIEKIKGNKNVTFTFTIANEDSIEACEVSTNQGGMISCVVDFELDEDSEVDVCMSLDGEDAINSSIEYKLKLEQNNPCGYTSLGGVKNSYDFPIFARPAKYAEVGDFLFNRELTGINLTTKIKNYIASNYNYNCSNGCIIPIKFSAGTKQDITISGLDLEYTSMGLFEESNLIYQLTEPNPVITLPLKNLDISKAGFIVPSTLGNHSFTLKLGSTTIFTDTVNIKPLPSIQSVTPSQVPALLETLFIATYDDSFPNLTGLSFNWDFGDGNKETSTTNQIRHKYNIEGNYTIKITMTSNLGTSSKNFPITVISPKDAILPLIRDYNSRLIVLEPQINNLPAWIKTEVVKKVNIANLRAEIKKQEDAFPLVSADQGYLIIMNNLVNLTVPQSLEKISVIKQPSKVFPSSNQLDTNALESFGAGEYPGTSRDYAASVNGWINENLDISLNAEEYYFNYPSGKKLIFSDYIIILTPKTSMNNIYFSISGSPDIITKDVYSLKTSGTKVGFEISGLTQSKTIEFLHPEKVSIGNFPFYLSPKISELDLSIVAGEVTCNLNGICEDDRGEDYKNCRADCKPVLKTIVYLILILILGLMAYILMQEWYKRHYESQLFSDKNQLYNLINFMNNALNQGIKKNEIIDKLEEMGWRKERLVYAWKKLNGQKTGMWEIPIFKWVEKKEVRNELQKRQGMSSQNTPPNPMGKPPVRSISRRPRNPRF